MPFAITSSDAPMSAITAIHSVAEPITARTRKISFQAERQRNVHLNVAERGAAETDGERNLQQLVGHQRDVGRLEGRVRACRAHRDADVGGRQRRRIVHAVADHRNRSVRLLQFVDGRDLVVRQQLRERLVDADLARERIGARLVVAGEHHDSPHALMPEQLDGVARRVARAIGERDDAERTSLAGDEHGRAARGRERIELRMNRGVAETALFDEPMVADERGMSADHRFCPAAGYRLELDRRGQRDARLDGSAQEWRGPQDVPIAPRGPRRSRESRRWRCSFSGITSTTCGTPLVSVPVLSNATHRIDADALEMRAALDQHASPRGGGDCGDD